MLGMCADQFPGLVVSRTIFASHEQRQLVCERSDLNVMSVIWSAGGSIN